MSSPEVPRIPDQLSETIMLSPRDEIQAAVPEDIAKLSHDELVARLRFCNIAGGWATDDATQRRYFKMAEPYADQLSINAVQREAAQRRQAGGHRIARLFRRHARQSSEVA